jgi:hypothetical protein
MGKSSSGLLWLHLRVLRLMVCHGSVDLGLAGVAWTALSVCRTAEEGWL